MKIKEVIPKPDDQLLEDIRRTNDTEFKDEDILKIMRVDQENRWYGPMTSDEMIEIIRTRKETLGSSVPRRNCASSTK